jgi:flagellar hook-basal body complex protein FliE
LPEGAAEPARNSSGEKTKTKTEGAGGKQPSHTKEKTMGFSIGGLLNDVGIKLPNIDLGSIGKTVLDEGKKLLGDVVKDSFTLSSQPGQVFDSNMNLNVLGDNIRLPNPIGSLANKLLGSADGELNKFGVNVDFKTMLTKLFHLPTESGAPVAVPPATTRAASFPATPAAAASASGAAGVGGGGGAVSANFDTAAPSVAVTGGSSIESTLSSALGTASSAMGKAEGELANAGQDEGKLQQAAADMQKANEMFSIISQILNDNHQTRMMMIQNMK